MLGYWNNAEATAKAFPLGRQPDNGWFDTGDLGWRVPYQPGSCMGGHIVIAGRQKDTIVLANGENVEPQPLEDLLCTSPHIQFAVLLGSGKRALGALLVPSQEALERAGGDAYGKAMHELMQGEVAHMLAGRSPHERIRAFATLAEPFTVEAGTLTHTMKPRKATIFAKYAEQVAEVEKELR
ncbi:hypothetical protein ABPG77_000153 [Micractinium sp. CCAP 211/92]